MCELIQHFRYFGVNTLLSFRKKLDITYNFSSNSPCVIRPFNFRLKSKIENWCQFLIFVIFIIKNTKVLNRKFFTFFPFDRILKHNLYFTLILSILREKWNWAYGIKITKLKIAEPLFRQCCSLWHGLVFLFSAEV